ncbi:MAG: hypothetical protein HY352_03800 [Candidatus Omnitrophica bacterium]|nr:hypothetical protein [Candidatus Omnitrophota bacterium]
MKQASRPVGSAESVSGLRWALFLFCLFSVPSVVYANAPVPMIAVTFPMMWAVLLPIILIEAAVYRSSFSTSYKRAVIPSVVSNLASTVAGFPFAWVLLFAVQVVFWLVVFGLEKVGAVSSDWTNGVLGDVLMIVFSGGWILPGGRDWTYRWVPVGAMIGLIPAYFLTVAIEVRVLRRFFKEMGQPEIRQAVRRANKLTYGLLFVLLLSILIVSVKVGYVNLPFWNF